MNARGSSAFATFCRHFRNKDTKRVAPLFQKPSLSSGLPQRMRISAICSSSISSRTSASGLKRLDWSTCSGSMTTILYPAFCMARGGRGEDFALGVVDDDGGGLRGEPQHVRDDVARGLTGADAGDEAEVLKALGLGEAQRLAVDQQSACCAAESHDFSSDFGANLAPVCWLNSRPLMARAVPNARP